MATGLLSRVPAPIIQHPLERLRSTIRRYVCIEGALIVGVFVVCWFWIGLALDYGSFKLASFDWVQELPRWFRGLLLATLSGTIALLATIKIAQRMTIDFRPDSLALVLENRFPAKLGDRLITAVELCDLDRAAERGYSRAMVADTIREAGHRVAEVPIREAFDWHRLIRLGKWLIVLTTLPLILFGVAYSAIRQTNPLEDFLPNLREVSTLWTKRNILLQDLIWPRKAYLEVLDFPMSGEVRVGRDAPSPRLRIKARRWVIADSAAPDGWRPMVWADLRPGLLGGQHAPALPESWLVDPQSQRDSAVSKTLEPWTLDRVEMAMEDEAIRRRFEEQAPNEFAAVQQVLSTLTQRSAEPAHRSLYRRLEVPDRIEVKYWGAQTSSRMELLRGPGWEYGGSLADLKESVKFWARGSDYYTMTRSIVLVPPPALQQLTKIEYRPAYLYHRPPVGNPPDGGPAALKGLKQKVEDLVSLNGATSRISLPAQTDLVLDGQLDKELQSIALRPRGKPSDGGSLGESSISVSDDRLGFQLRFENINEVLDFYFEFTDTDGVKSSRHVIIEPFSDPVPSVNVAIDGIRMTKQGHYLVTPVALIPFEGKVNDGPPGALGGLDRVDYQISLTRLEAASIAANQAASVAAAILPLIGGRQDCQFTNSVAAALTGEIIRAIVPTTSERVFAVDTFQQLMRDLSVRDVNREELINRLNKPPLPSALVRDFTLQPRFEGFDLRERLPDLKITGDLEVQPRYRMKLNVSATDNNIETGPNTSANKEPPYTVMVVSETELLVEVARDEEAQHVKIEDVISRLREVRSKLDRVSDEIPATTDTQLGTLAQRALEMTESVAKARDVVQDVYAQYGRILRELELNRVSAQFIAKVKGEICLPLDSCLKGEFTQAEESLEEYRKQLDVNHRPDAALTGLSRQKLDRLIAKLNQIMAAMGEVTTLNKLIATLREIEKGQEQIIAVRLKELQRQQRDKLIRDLEKLKGTEGP